MTRINKNVLFIINGLRLGGMERQLVELIKALSGTTVNSYLAVLNTTGPYTDIVQQYLKKPIYYLDRRKGKIFSTLRKLDKITKEEKIDLIHVQDSFSCYYAMLVVKRNRLPLINGMIRHAGVSKGLVYIIEKWMLQISDTIIANSKAGLKYYGIKHGHVIYNMIDQSRFKQAQGSLQNIVMIANFTKYKDQRTLLFAAAKLIKDGKINKIGFIGDGPKIESCEKLSKELGILDHTCFYGHMTNVEKELTNYGIGILCSTKKYNEGISNSILEYMGSGLIAVASNVGAIDEIIDDGVNGFMFEAENSQSLYEKLNLVLAHDNLKDIRNNAGKTLEQKFNVKLNILKIVDIYQSLRL